MAAQPKQQPRQNRLAVHHRRRPREAEAAIPCNMNNSGYELQDVFGRGQTASASSMLSLVCVLIHSLDQPLQHVNRYQPARKSGWYFSNFRPAQTFSKLQKCPDRGRLDLIVAAFPTELSTDLGDRSSIAGPAGWGRARPWSPLSVSAIDPRSGAWPNSRAPWRQRRRDQPPSTTLRRRTGRSVGRINKHLL